MRGLYAIVAFTVLASTVSIAVMAWEDCPYGLMDDPFPGLCRRYVDTDADGLCDHSQPSPEERAASTTPADAAPPDTDGTDVEAPEQETPNDSGISQTYHVIPILAAVGGLYALTYALSKKGTITLAMHRKAWNFALLGTFLVSGLLGLALAVAINFGWTMPIKSLFVHVEFGIAMAGVSLLHAAWHWKYYVGGASNKGDCPPSEGKGRNRGRRRA